MTAYDRECLYCHKPFTAHSSNAKFDTSACRARWRRKKERDSKADDSSEPEKPPVAGVSSVTDSVLAEIERLGVASSVSAALALAAARGIDDVDTGGTAKAALIRSLQQILAELRNVDDGDDELAKIISDDTGDG